MQHCAKSLHDAVAIKRSIASIGVGRDGVHTNEHQQALAVAPEIAYRAVPEVVKVASNNAVNVIIALAQGGVEIFVELLV